MMMTIRNKGFVLPILVFVILGLCGFGVYYLWQTGVKDSPKVEIKKPDLKQVFNVNATPTPFEFNDVTIPFLRSKEYKSSLAIEQKIGENAAYTSYVASYTSDGFKVNGLLTEPKTVKPEGGYPAIVFIHGYIPPKEYRTKVNYVSYVDYLAKQGFVVFKIDLRGHDQSEGEAGGAYYAGDYVIDALNAYSALGNYNNVNSKRIGFWGHSMAGNIVFRSIVIKKDVPAAVIWAGAGYTYTDLQEYTIDDNSYRPPPQDSEVAKKRARLRELYGSFEPNHWFWKQVPGTNYLEGVTGALQLNHAQNDNVVSVEYSRNLMDILDKSTLKHELIEYDSGGHNLTGESFTAAMENTVEFFSRNLK